MNKKTSADYQREFRRRLRAQGLIKKELWILPEHAQQLGNIEKQLRLPGGSAQQNSGDNIMDKVPMWTTQSLCEALQKSDLIESNRARLELIDGAEPSLLVEMVDYGDLPVFITVSGEQTIVESVLWPMSAVTDVAGFNEAVLRTHKYFPLSTISLDKVQGEEDYYHMFGALSSSSLLVNIVLEIETLASNVIQATEAYGEFLSIAVDA